MFRCGNRLALFVSLFFAILPTGSPIAAAEPPIPRVYVILWFDTEDYILPASDDAALHLADWLTSENIREHSRWSARKRGRWNDAAELM